MNQEFQDILSELKWVASFQKGEKIDKSSMSVVYDNIITKIWRTLIQWGKENREDGFDVVKKIIERAFDFIRHNQNEEYNTELKKALIETIKGLNEYYKTYHDDKSFQSKIQAFITTIRIELIQLSKEPDELASDSESYSSGHSNGGYSPGGHSNEGHSDTDQDHYRTSIRKWANLKNE